MRTFNYSAIKNRAWDSDILSSIEGALRKLVSTGELKREGIGKSTCYLRLK